MLQELASTPTNAIDFSGVSFGISVNDLISSATSLISVFGPYIALGIALLLAPRFIAMLKQQFRGGRTK